MSANVGKTPGVIYVNQDQIISFHNSEITSQDQDLYFFDSKTSEVPRYQLSASAYKNMRCLHYNLFSAVKVYSQLNHIVLFQQDGTVSPLFQTINVNAFHHNDSYSVCFWSVLANDQTTKIKWYQAKYSPDILGKTFEEDGQQYVYSYDPNKILKFYQNQLQDYQLQDQYKNIFCSADVQYETYYVGTMPDGSDSEQQKVMIIKMQPKVLQQQDDLYPVLDFSVGGGSGSVAQHQHIPYIDGTSYAFSVFHPGTSMPQLSWKNV